MGLKASQNSGSRSHFRKQLTSQTQLTYLQNGNRLSSPSKGFHAGLKKLTGAQEQDRTGKFSFPFFHAFVL